VHNVSNQVISQHSPAPSGGGEVVDRQHGCRSEQGVEVFGDEVAASRGSDLGHHLHMSRRDVTRSKGIAECGMFDGHRGGVDETVGLATPDRAAIRQPRGR
jgi:hypothetical protein